MWGLFGSSSTPTFSEDKTQFLDFFPTTCAQCRQPSKVLFDCLSSKSLNHLKSEDTVEKKEAASLMKAECQTELIAYNECMLSYYSKKNADAKFKAFRVQEEYRKEFLDNKKSASAPSSS
jgi:Na+-translocating ferredoxin:NAD+ oxidoreductase RnfC subunit